VSAPLLTTEGLCRAFGGVRALDGVTLSAPAGLIHGVIGPNGAGKTTLFNAVTGVISVDGGRVLLDGGLVTGLPTHAIAALGVTRTFQTPQLFVGMSARETVMVGAHLRTRAGFLASCLRLPLVFREEKWVREEAMKWLSFVGLSGDARVQAVSLPFGKQRLLEIARALACEPRLLLLDEPAAGLNNTESAALADLIRRIKSLGVTVMLVEHDMDLVMSTADHLFVMDQGRLIAEGTPAEVSRSPVVIKAYLGEG
jgi:branched-chain amino acid transport system ATP-binding protein